jgi:regulator of cell morphogenesis and NO signaling
MPRLTAIIDKVCNAHGARFSQLYEVRDIFGVLRAEFEAHIVKEEMVLFPLIRQVEELWQLGGTAHTHSIQYPINAMEAEHETTGKALEDIRRLTGNYSAPAGACNTYLAMLDGLNALEIDTHRHVHKENNILFARAIILDQQSAATKSH